MGVVTTTKKRLVVPTSAQKQNQTQRIVITRTGLEKELRAPGAWLLILCGLYSTNKLMKVAIAHLTTTHKTTPVARLWANNSRHRTAGATLLQLVTLQAAANRCTGLAVKFPSHAVRAAHRRHGRIGQTLGAVLGQSC